MSSIAVDGGGPLTEKKPPRKKRKMLRPRKKKTLRASNISALFDQASLNKTELVFMTRFNHLSENPNFRPVFSGKTKSIYFPHGNITEGIAMKYIQNKFLNRNKIVWQQQEEQSFNVYETEYASIFNTNHIQSGFKARIGVGSGLYKDDLCPYIISSRPDGIYDDSHIIEIKSPWGNLTKMAGAGESDDKYDCKINHRLQVFLECLCHNKKKAFYFMYYNPYGWERFLTKMASQFNKGVKVGDIVFKPDIHPDMNMFTVMQRIDAIGWFDYAKRTAGVSAPTGKKTTDVKMEYERERPKILNLIYLTSIKSLMDFGYDRAMATKIYQKFKFGNDIHRGVVKEIDGDNITVLWDAIKNEENVIFGPGEETMTKDLFRAGYLHILKVLNSSIRRKSPEWKAWERDVFNGVIPMKSPGRMGYEECVWLELDFSDRELRNELTDALNDFLTTMYTGNNPWHTKDGNSSKRNLENILKSIPVRQISPSPASSSSVFSITDQIKKLKF